MCWPPPPICSNSTKQNTTPEASSSSSSTELSCILWNSNSKFHFCADKNSPPVPVLSLINPVQNPQTIYWRSILIWSSQVQLCLPSGLLPSGFPTILCTHVSCRQHVPYVLSTSLLLIGHSNNDWWEVQITQLLTMRFPPVSCYLVLLRPK